jgi:fatty-acyl-CoA synthase
VPRSDVGTVDVEGVDAHCAASLAGYKRPRIVIVGELPRNATGKVDRRQLKALVTAIVEGSR